MTFVFFIFGCSGFEFVYEKSLILKELESNSVLSVGGDDIPIIKSYFRQKIGYSNDGGYLIKITSTKEETLQVIDIDATASKIDINHNIEYILISNTNDCQIVSKSFSTTSTYDSKSAGFNFGSDISKNDISKQNIEKNIQKFLNLISTKDGLRCVGEN